MYDVCMYNPNIDIHIYIYIYIYTHTHVYIHIYTHVKNKYTHMYACLGSAIVEGERLQIGKLELTMDTGHPKCQRPRFPHPKLLLGYLNTTQ